MPFRVLDGSSLRHHRRARTPARSRSTPARFRADLKENPFRRAVCQHAMKESSRGSPAGTSELTFDRPIARLRSSTARAAHGSARRRSADPLATCVRLERSAAVPRPGLVDERRRTCSRRGGLVPGSGQRLQALLAEPWSAASLVRKVQVFGARLSSAVLLSGVGVVSPEAMGCIPSRGCSPARENIHRMSRICTSSRFAGDFAISRDERHGGSSSSRCDDRRHSL